MVRIPSGWTLARLKRGNGRGPAGHDSELQRAAADQRPPSQLAVLRERFELAEQALQRLPEHYRQVILRTRIRGESYALVAASLQRTVPSLRNLLHRALVKLGVEMDRLHHGDGGAPPAPP